jgi:dihydroorotate dehydrogenase (NAD+) catalytic subunit
MVKTSVRIGALQLPNPVLAASGTFGFGKEMSAWQDLSKLGGICSKGITLVSRPGNPPPRVAETASGMLNSVGLQNPGLSVFLREELPFMLSLGCPVIINIAGQSIDEYVAIGEALDQTGCTAIELNLSCPNVKTGCHLIGSDPKQIEPVVRQVRQVTQKPLWVKLTPNVTDIVPMAQAAEAGGADAVVLINTLLGLAVDRKSRRPILFNNTGGLSGPAIKPIALRMVSDVFRHVSIPVIGVGGIVTGSDAIEFLIAGASAVEIGTANLVSPTACLDILENMIMLAQEEGVKDLSDYTGTLSFWP